MASNDLSFSVILTDIKQKYIIDEGIEPINFIEMLCKCQNEPLMLNGSNRLGQSWTLSTCLQWSEFLYWSFLKKFHREP